MLYYTLKNNEIYEMADFLFSPDALETDREIIRGREGKLYFQGEEPLLPLKEARACALEALRMRKWEAKNSGITVNGIAIDTDDRGQATINGAVTNVLVDPAFTARWKTSAVDELGGAVWVDIAGPMILGLAKAMTVYTEACFAVEAAKQAEVVALVTSEEVKVWMEKQLDTGWPSREVALEIIE